MTLLLLLHNPFLCSLQQRMEYKKRYVKQEKSSLTNKRQQLLESIGFNWGKPKGQASWDEKFVSYGRKKLLLCKLCDRTFSSNIIDFFTIHQQNEIIEYKAKVCQDDIDVLQCIFRLRSV